MNREIWQETAATFNVFFTRKLDAGEAEPQAALFPLVGALTGLAASLTAGFAGLFFGRLAAAILAAIALTLIFELMTDWQGLKNLSAYLTLRFRNTSIAEAFFKKTEFQKEMTPIFIFISIYLLRALAFGFITYRSPSVFLLVFTGAYLVRTALVSCAEEDAEPLLELPEEKKNTAYLITIAVFILIGVFSFHAKLLAAAVVLIIFALFIRRIQVNTILRYAERSTLRIFEVYGYSAETLLLLAGIIVS